MILQQNYTDAAERLDHAVALKPYHADALYFLAKAHTGLFENNKLMADSEKAKELIGRTLKVSPGHKQSLTLLSQLRREESEGKKTKLYIMFGLAGVLVLFSVIGFSSYNSARNQAIVQEESVSQAWAQVENVYQRRADLIPQLVTVVKQSAYFETSMIEKITEAHATLASSQTKGLDAGEMADFNQKQETLTKAINKLFVAVQQYPELKTMEGYQNLQVQIEGSENRISVERRKFNKAVQAYNTYIRQFPQSMMGFDAKPYFEADKKGI